MSPEQSTWAGTGTVHGDHTELSSCPAAVFVKQISAKDFQPKLVGLCEATRAGEKVKNFYRKRGRFRISLCELQTLRGLECGAVGL